MKTITGFNLPELPPGFEWPLGVSNLSRVTISGKEGIVTVNFINRSFVLGYGNSNQFGGYRGRKWKQDLVNDAIKAMGHR